MTITTVQTTAAERRALEAIDPAAIVHELADLVSVPSVSGSDEESEVQHLLGARVGELGLDVDLWGLDLVTLAGSPEFPGMEADRDEAWGLVASTADLSTEPALVLQGHVDVVPAGAEREWSGDAFTPVISTDRVHGRGTCDMKAGVVANLAAATAIRRAGIVLREPLALHFVIGEEDGGVGAFGTMARGHRGAACIITEPTSGTLTTANAGALTFRLEIAGRATHASTAYEGSSAIDSYIAIHRGLADLQRRRNRMADPLMSEYLVPYPISVGKLAAGDWASSVPDQLVADGRMGVRLDEDPADARRELEEHIATIASRDPFLRRHPPRVTWPGGQFASGRTSAGHPIGEVVRQAHADATLRPRPRERGAPYGSDLRLYEAAGIPTVHYGPGDVRLAHSPRESVLISEVLDVTRALVLTILRTCGAYD